MYEKRFTAVVGPDRTIRLPEGVNIEPGPVVITVWPQPTPGGANALRDRMVQAAREHYVPGSLPSDLAENHDHYLHGLPKGIDRP